MILLNNGLSNICYYIYLLLNITDISISRLFHLRFVHTHFVLLNRYQQLESIYENKVKRVIIINIFETTIFVLFFLLWNFYLTDVLLLFSSYFTGYGLTSLLRPDSFWTQRLFLERPQTKPAVPTGYQPCQISTGLFVVRTLSLCADCLRLQPVEKAGKFSTCGPCLCLHPPVLDDAN